MVVIKSGFKSKFKSKSAPVDYGGDQVSWYTVDYGGDQVSWYIIEFMINRPKNKIRKICQIFY